MLRVPIDNETRTRLLHGLGEQETRVMSNFLSEYDKALTRPIDWYCFVSFAQEEVPVSAVMCVADRIKAVAFAHVVVTEGNGSKVYIPGRGEPATSKPIGRLGLWACMIRS